MTVSRLSMDDINQVRLSSSKQDSFSAANSSAKKPVSPSFVGRLSDDQIANFFDPYGLISFNRMMDNGVVRGICVYCLDFVCTFSDFDVIVYPIEDIQDYERSFAEYASTHEQMPSFNIASFKLYCDSIETTPEKAIESRITNELLGGLKKYNDTHANFVPKRINENFENIPPEYKKLLSAAKDDQEIVAKRNEILQILEKYGSYENIEALISRSNQ